eukprot:1797823-Prymnesium_polylepis.1
MGRACGRPQDFLDLIMRLPLVAEPEVLEGFDTSDVLLPRRFMRGSEARTPRGLWKVRCH